MPIRRNASSNWFVASIATAFPKGLTSLPPQVDAAHQRFGRFFTLSRIHFWILAVSSASGSFIVLTILSDGTCRRPPTWTVCRPLGVVRDGVHGDQVVAPDR